MLGREFTIGDQVAYIVRGSTRVSVLIGEVVSMNVINYTVTLKVVAGAHEADIGRTTSPVRDHNVLLLKAVQS